MRQDMLDMTLDIKRQEELKLKGLHFLRFNDKMVKTDIDNVLKTIEVWIKNFENTHKR